MTAKTLAVVGAVLATLASPALAHITLETTEAPAGSTHKAVLRVGHGYEQTLTEGVREIIWSGGELPEEWYDEFTFRVQLPAGEVGQILYFPVVQECGDTTSRWIEILAEGQSSDNLEEPAPAVTLTAPVDGH